MSDMDVLRTAILRGLSGVASPGLDGGSRRPSDVALFMGKANIDCGRFRADDGADTGSMGVGTTEPLRPCPLGWRLYGALTALTTGRIPEICD